MIRHTFSVLDGIGERLERRLWGQGLLTWDDFIDAGSVPFISEERGAVLRETILYFREELLRYNHEPFYTFLRSRDHWRLFDVFRSDAVCLDIETNGLPPGRGGRVTVVGLYDGRHWRCLIDGVDLTAERLEAELSGYRLLITFFGSSFDLPFLRRCFPGFRPRLPHFDVCFGARRVGIRGGLKRIEAAFGLSRSEDVRGMDGYDAVLLWRRWLKGSTGALDLLLRYNREDTVNLLFLAERIYALLRASTGIEEFLNTSGHGPRGLSRTGRLQC